MKANGRIVRGYSAPGGKTRVLVELDTAPAALFEEIEAKLGKPSRTVYDRGQKLSRREVAQEIKRIGNPATVGHVKKKVKCTLEVG